MTRAELVQQINNYKNMATTAENHFYQTGIDLGFIVACQSIEIAKELTDYLNSGRELDTRVSNYHAEIAGMRGISLATAIIESEGA